jgi:cytochrome oxidase Cu insertion factor (SCO1/SenC/PrrC family)
LSQFRGKAVVLSFNDDRCTDVCTLLAQDIVRADQDLGRTGRSRVAFVSVNVNPFYPQVRYVKQWSDQQDLGSLPNWHFGTAPVPNL